MPRVKQLTEEEKQKKEKFYVTDLETISGIVNSFVFQYPDSVLNWRNVYDELCNVVPNLRNTTATFREAQLFYEQMHNPDYDEVYIVDEILEMNPKKELNGSTGLRLLVKWAGFKIEDADENWLRVEDLGTPPLIKYMRANQQAFVQALTDASEEERQCTLRLLGSNEQTAKLLQRMNLLPKEQPKLSDNHVKPAISKHKK